MVSTHPPKPTKLQIYFLEKTLLLAYILAQWDAIHFYSELQSLLLCAETRNLRIHVLIVVATEVHEYFLHVQE